MGYSRIALFVVVSAILVSNISDCLKEMPGSGILGIIEGGQEIENAYITGNFNLTEALFQERIYNKSNSKILENNNTLILNSPIIIKNSLIQGETDFSNIIFLGIINLEDVIFEKDANFGDAQFNKTVIFNNCSFKKSVVFRNSQFWGNFTFYGSCNGIDTDYWGSRFHRCANFENAIFNGSISFSNTSFLGDANFCGSEFHKDTDFRESNLNSVNFDSTIFHDKADFHTSVFNNTSLLEVHFNSSIFKDTHFNGESIFKGAIFNLAADFSNAQFNDTAQFQGAEFKGGADFKNTKFRDDVSFWGSLFEGKADFLESKFYKIARFAGTQFLKPETSFIKTEFFGDADFSKLKVNESIDFSKSNFNGKANFAESQLGKEADFEDVVFNNVLNLTRAKYGKIYIKWNSISSLSYSENAYSTLIKNFRDNGLYNDANECYYEFMKQNFLNRNPIESHRNLAHIISLSVGNLILKALELFALIFYGFGTKPHYPIIWSMIVILFFISIWKRRASKETKNSEILGYSAAVFLSGTKLFINEPDTPKWLDTKNYLKYYYAERILGAIFSVLLFLAISNTLLTIR
jgi:hypothetical protein